MKMILHEAYELGKLAFLRGEWKNPGDCEQFRALLENHKVTRNINHAHADGNVYSCVSDKTYESASISFIDGWQDTQRKKEK